ncbi:hypothetical protein EUAN_06720 [Andreesenia angusta]|uniref:Bacteriophage holin n=1 Tax=Andreesenia angusta TaxID=39480 RepID=A0A1S1V8G7_9FIRM|nr:holin [Andreesenia angusta]OHW62888.1 hypothetical protein EUAN_06720 [Andreesenia angusta]
MSNRFKNYGLWVAVFALIPLALEAFGIGALPKNYEELTTGILTVAVLAGVVNNPSHGRGLKDKKY